MNVKTAISYLGDIIWWGDLRLSEDEFKKQAQKQNRAKRSEHFSLG